MTALGLEDSWTTLIAAYAAIVATGALALEVWRWLESGPRLSVEVAPDTVILNVPGTQDKSYLVATVTNRGAAPTTIMSFGLQYYQNWLDRFRSKPDWTGAVVSPHLPGYPRNVPEVLQPGEVWRGVVLREEFESRVDQGLLYVMISTSHREKPIMKKVITRGLPTDAPPSG